MVDFLELMHNRVFRNVYFAFLIKRKAKLFILLVVIRIRTS